MRIGTVSTQTGLCDGDGVVADELAGLGAGRDADGDGDADGDAACDADGEAGAGRASGDGTADGCRDGAALVGAAPDGLDRVARVDAAGTRTADPAPAAAG